jgi:hypothetical protein
MSETRVYLEDLERDTRAGCGDPECLVCGGAIPVEVRRFHSRCHPKAGTWMFFKRGTDFVRVRCRKCGAVVCDLAVQSRRDGFAA